MAGAAFNHSAVVGASKEDVWDRLQSAATWADIGPVERVWNPTHGADGELLGYQWSTTVAGRKYEGRAQTIATHRMENMLLSLDGGEVSALLTTSLTAVGTDRTEIDVTIELEPKGMMGTLFFPIISSAVRNGLEDHLDAFASKLAANE